MRDAIILDVDGTLCDVSSVRYHVDLTHPYNTGEKRFDRFHSESVDCPPHQEALDEYHKAREEGLAILVVTGRMEEWKCHTMTWLKEHEVIYDELYMRPQDDCRKDVIVKTMLLEQIREDGYRPVLAVDDNPAIIGLWKNKGIQVIKIAGWEE